MHDVHLLIATHDSKLGQWANFNPRAIFRAVVTEDEHFNKAMRVTVAKMGFICRDEIHAQSAQVIGEYTERRFLEVFLGNH